MKKEKLKAKTQNFKPNISEISEFIVIEDSFIQIEKLSLDTLERKLLANQNASSTQNN